MQPQCHKCFSLGPQGVHSKVFPPVLAKRCSSRSFDTPTTAHFNLPSASHKLTANERGRRNCATLNRNGGVRKVTPSTCSTSREDFQVHEHEQQQISTTALSTRPSTSQLTNPNPKGCLKSQHGIHTELHTSSSEHAINNNTSESDHLSGMGWSRTNAYLPDSGTHGAQVEHEAGVQAHGGGRGRGRAEGGLTSSIKSSDAVLLSKEAIDHHYKFTAVAMTFMLITALALATLINLGAGAGGVLNALALRDLACHGSWTAYTAVWGTVTHLLTLYTSAADTWPLITKAMTSAAAYAIGDFCSQFFGKAKRNLHQVSMARVVRSTIAGGIIHGPMCHYWLEFADQTLHFGGAWWNVFVKVFVDQTVWSFLLNSLYTTCILALQLRSPILIWSEIQATWYNAISAGWKLWPFVHCITFSGVIPDQLKVLWVDVIEVLWVMILATVVNRDREDANDREEIEKREENRDREDASTASHPNMTPA